MAQAVRRAARRCQHSFIGPVITLMAIGFFAGPFSARAQDSPLETALASFELREIGPAVMGGRVTDIAVHASDPETFYVAFATGGVWKTTNHAISWTPLFDDQPTASIGAVALAPSNPKIVWVGTGEADNRQSSAWGAGIFKSLDGGETWMFMGLENTRHIGRIVVHPTNPEIVYVAAAGHLWGPNPDRGVYKTTDGGESWQKVLYVNENTGAIDIAMDPNAPNVLFAAMYQRRRTAWGFSADGHGSGLYRTLDGGESWVELTAADGAASADGAESSDGAGDGEGADDGEGGGDAVAFNERGLPTGNVGRIGLDVHDPDSDLVYATIESREDGHGLYRSTDRGETWEKVSDRNPRPMYFSLVRIDPNNPDRIYLGGVGFSISDDGGKTWWEGDAAQGVHLDHHAIWVDPTSPGHVIIGNDGGVATTWDGGESWQHHHNIPVGQYYQIGLDMRDPYWICGGLQDNNSWCGPSRTLDQTGIRNRHWKRTWGGDGFWSVADPVEPEFVYAESQNGNLGRYNRVTGESVDLQPIARPTPEDTAREYRFHWNTPIVVSQHNSSTLYVGANHLMRSTDRGMTWDEASPDLTRRIDRDTLPIMGMPVDSTTLSRNDGVGAYGAIFQIGESSLDPDVIYVGTDDGKLWVTRTGGDSWTNLTENVEGLRHGYFVSAIEPSHHQPGRVYMAMDGHKSDDYGAYVFVSENYGEDWESITTGLPSWSVNVIREHPDTPGLLFLGNEIGVYVSVNGGSSWSRLTANLATAPVDDIRIHPRENDLVVATHGRSIWILHDVTPLERIAGRDDLLASAVQLFPTQEATMWSLTRGAWFPADDDFIGENPPVAARIRYWLAEDLAPAASDDEPLVTAAADRGRAGGQQPGDAGLDGLGDLSEEEFEAFEAALARRASRGGGAPFGYADADAARAGAADAGAADAGTAGAAPEPADVEIQILNGSGEVIRTVDGPGDSGINTVYWNFRIKPPVESVASDDLPWWQRPPQGPRVLPGSYTVRLIAAGDTQTTGLDVRLDPRIEVTREVLAERQAALMDAYALAGPFYQAEQAADTAESRLDAAREQLQKLDTDGAEALLAEADSIEADLEDVMDRIDELDPGVMREIGGIYDSPTADQLWLLERAREEAPAAIEALNEIITERLPAFQAKVFQPAALPEPIEAVEM